MLVQIDPSPSYSQPVWYVTSEEDKQYVGMGKEYEATEILGFSFQICTHHSGMVEVGVECTKIGKIKIEDSELFLAHYYEEMNFQIKPKGFILQNAECSGSDIRKQLSIHLSPFKVHCWVWARVLCISQA